MDLHPLATINPRDDVTVTTGWLFFWRHRIDDGIYTTSGSLLRSAAGTRSRFVGHSPGIEVLWQVTRQHLGAGQRVVVHCRAVHPGVRTRRDHQLSRCVGEVPFLIHCWTDASSNETERMATPCGSTARTRGCA